MTNHLKACHKEGYKSLQTVEAPILVLFMISGLLKKITYFANLRRVKINRCLIGSVLLIVIASQLIYKRFPPLVVTVICDDLSKV